MLNLKKQSKIAKKSPAGRCELTPEEKVIYNDYFFHLKHPDYTAMIRSSQDRFIYQTLKKQSYENNQPF